MKLGLDLRGGVHFFLMEVDMETALGKLQEQNVDSLRTLLRDEGIPYSSIRKTDNYGVETVSATLMTVLKHQIILRVVTVRSSFLEMGIITR